MEIRKENWKLYKEDKIPTKDRLVWFKTQPGVIILAVFTSLQVDTDYAWRPVLLTHGQLSADFSRGLVPTEEWLWQYAD